MFDLTDRIAVVSGGAGAIGSAIASGLGQCGADVVLIGRTLAALEAAAMEMRRHTQRTVSSIVTDVTDEASVDLAVEQLVERCGRVDILVNAHGVNFKAPAVDYPMHEWDALFATNAFGTMVTCKAFGRLMVANGTGRIVNVSSVRGIRANQGGNAGYAATKGAVDMITRTLAAEWAPKGVTVNAIAPALIATKLTERQMQEPGRAERYLSNIPVGRLGQAADCVGAAVFLASDEASFVTGQILYVDGGLTAIG